MSTPYACPFCGELRQRDLAYRCGLCSSSAVDEVDKVFLCDSCGQIRASDLSTECGICGTEELATLESV